MDREMRIEAARRAMFAVLRQVFPDLAWDTQTLETTASDRQFAEAALSAGVPELFADPPTHLLVPLYALEAKGEPPVHGRRPA